MIEMPKYYDLHVHSKFSVGENSIEELAEFAELLGYSGIGICDHFQNISKFKEQKKEIRRIQKDLNIEIFHGVEVQPNTPQELNKKVKKLRRLALIIIVHGGFYNINRAACQNPMVDILAHPELGRTDNGLDEFCIRSAAENDVAIQINFREILYGYRKPRMYILSHIMENVRLCNELKANMIICSGAQTKWDMRDPRTLSSIGNVLGLELGNSIKSISEVPERIIQENKAKLSGKLITKGIEVIE